MKTEAMATKIADQILHRQTKIANYLNRKTQYWNSTSKLIALSLFVLLFGSICIYLIIKSL